MAVPFAPAVIEIDEDAVNELVHSDEAHALVAAKCVEIRDLARAYNPSDAEKPFIYAGRSHDAPEDVAAGEVGYVSAIWHIIEFGSVKNPPYRPLSRAVVDAGARFT